MNIGPDLIETMLAPTPLSWLLPIYGLIDPITIDTDDLCASIPGYPESWGVDDLLAGVDVARHPDVLAKLIRMAKASVWGTYCELTPPEGGLPRLLDAMGSEFDSADQPSEGVIDYVMPLVSEGADFHVLYIKNLQGDPSGLGMRIRSGDLETATSPTLLDIGGTSGDWATRMLVPGAVVAAGPPEVIWSGLDSFWHLQHGPGSTGRWLVQISSWSLVDEAPTPVTAWPYAPPEIRPYQFSDECHDLLCQMAAEWSSHRIAGALVNGQLVEIVGMLEDLAAAAPVGTELVAGPSGLSGGTARAIPAGAVGVAVSVTAPANVARSGSAPVLLWDAGYIAVGRADAWHPSVRLKHPIQLLYPFPAGVTDLALDLALGCTADLAWVMPVA